jgi:hypothetical protein
MEWEFCIRSSKLHVWKIGISFLQIVKNDEEIYMQLKNIQQKIAKYVEVYYEQLFKPTNCL